MIKIFGLRIPTKNDIAILNTNMEKCEEHIKELEEKHKRLSEYVTAISYLVDALAEERINSFNRLEKTKKTKK